MRRWGKLNVKNWLRHMKTNYLRKLREKIGADFSAPYGVTGTVAAFGSDGGADQWTMPLSAQQMEDLGILYTK